MKLWFEFVCHPNVVLQICLVLYIMVILHMISFSKFYRNYQEVKYTIKLLTEARLKMDEVLNLN